MKRLVNRWATATLALIILLAAVPALADTESLPHLAVYDLALERALAYYAEADIGSWEDILAMYSIGLDVAGIDMPEGLSLTAQVLCAAATGRDPYLYSGALAPLQLEDGSFGDSLTDHIYAMLALKIAPADTYDKDAAMAYLLEQQAEDGSFEAWGSFAEPTGSALLVLEGGAAEKAYEFLCSQMTDDGGWIGYPEYADQPDPCTMATVLSGFYMHGNTAGAETYLRLIAFQDEETGAFRYMADGEIDPDFATPQGIRVLGEIFNGSVYARLAGAAQDPEGPPEPDRPYGPDPFADFSAIPEWGREAVWFAFRSNFMVGDEQHRFLPTGLITRMELAMIMMKLGLGSEDAEGFSAEYADVKESDWFAAGVRYVSERGLMGGYGGNFRPYERLTREQIAVVLARSLDLVVTIEDRQPSDIGEVTPAYADAVQAVFTEGIMIGDEGRFTPKGWFSRLELAGLLMNLHK